MPFRIDSRCIYNFLRLITKKVGKKAISAPEQKREIGAFWRV